MQKIGDITNTADSHGEFTNGNVAAGIPPTLLEAEWFNTVQREIINVLLKAGMQPNKTNDAQLSEAIGKLVSDSKVPLTDSLGQSSALAASQKLVNQVNDNANSRLEKEKNGADIPDIDLFNKNIGACRAFGNGINIGGNGTWTTLEFIQWLRNQGAFEHPYWMCIGEFNYGKARIITDTKCGHIHLAGAIVEVMGPTIRVTTASKSSDGGIPAAQFTYANYGAEYNPGWRRDYNTLLRPAAADVGALSQSANGADILNKPEFVDNIGLTDAVARANGRVLINPRDGAIQTINSGVKINGRVSISDEVNTLSGTVVMGLKTSEGYPEIVYKFKNSGWSSLRVPQGHGTALSLGVNCWVAEGGFIKVASPIIQIYPTGKFTTNDESEGATVTKPGLGHYQVTGVLGYNADGAWGVHGGISSPKNNNGLELIYIDDKVNKDGSITIETFHRQHSHLPVRFQNKRIKAIVNGEKVYYQDGEPCDIPEGCRLDVRVQMPANSVWNVRQKVAEVATDSDQAESVE